MTPRVWIERPIESVEDAEALPEGTPAIAEHDFVRDRCIGGWTGGNGDLLYSHADMVGWTALVPVEAEVEWATDESLGRWSTDGIYPSPEAVLRDRWTDPLVRRYVTPWEALWPHLAAK